VSPHEVRRRGARTFLSGTALPDDASNAFHRKHGVREVGTLRTTHTGGRDISST
jgi:L-amino acid N-acyltransferase YncA